MLLNCLFVGCGGFVGSIARYLCGFLQFEGAPIPLTTLGINVLGSFLITFAAGLFMHALPLNEHWQLLFRVGLCGGFTTFSTFSSETLTLIEQGNIALAVLYALVSVVLCVIAALLGQLASSAC